MNDNVNTSVTHTNARWTVADYPKGSISLWPCGAMYYAIEVQKQGNLYYKCNYILPPSDDESAYNYTYAREIVYTNTNIFFLHIILIFIDR